MWRWERDLQIAREHVRWQPSLEAEAELAEVLGRWRQDPFHDAIAWAFARAALKRLSELPRDGRLELADFRIGMGRFREALGDLALLEAEFPGEYAIWERLIISYWRSGQDQAAARGMPGRDQDVHRARTGHWPRPR